jgi:hypothetical protein
MIIVKYITDNEKINTLRFLFCWKYAYNEINYIKKDIIRELSNQNFDNFKFI